MRMRNADCGLRIEKQIQNPKSKIRNPKSARELLKILEAQLQATGIPTARAEAEWLLADLLRTGRTELYLRESPLDSQVVDAAVGLLDRRLHGESLQQVLGSAEFFGHRLLVRPEVFVPRPETEALAEQAIGVLGRWLHKFRFAKFIISEDDAETGRTRQGTTPTASRCEAKRVGGGGMCPSPPKGGSDEKSVSVEAPRAVPVGRLHQGMTFPRVLDLGTGTGNLAITIAKAVPTCVVVAVELSWEASSVARANVRAHGLDERVHIVQADWTAGISGSWEVIVSNPPYVATSDVERLLAAGLGDPRLSLDGGPDGMAFARRLLEEAPQLLARHGALVMECAESQVEVLARLAKAQSWANRIQLFDDLAGRPRGLVIEAHT